MVVPAGKDSSATPAAAWAPAKYRTVIIYPPIADMGRDGCRNAGSSMPWPGSLPHIASRHRCGDLLVVGAAAQQPAQIGLAGGEQAVAHLAVGGQPGAVAVAAERPGHRADHADLGRAAVDQPGLGRGAGALGRIGRQLELGAQRGAGSPPR